MEQPQKQQPNLEAIHNLLQQVQSQLTNQAAHRRQTKSRKTSQPTRSTKPNTFMREPIIVRSDNYDVLDHSASTEQ